MTNTANDLLRVFLCHSSRDKDKVRTLYDNLIREGFDPWLDEEKLLPGQDWDLEIRQALKGSDAVIVCLSPNSVTKAGYVQKEIKFALDLADEQPEGAIFLIPARIKPCAIPDRLSHLHSPEIFEEKGYRRLIEALRIRTTKLKRQILNPHDGMANSNSRKLDILLRESFGKVFLSLYWEKYQGLVSQNNDYFTVSLIGATATGKTSLAYMLSKNEFNFLDQNPKTKGVFHYRFALLDQIRITDYGSYSDGIEWQEKLLHIKDNTDLILFTVSPDIKLDSKDIKALQELDTLNIPLAVIVNKIDYLNGKDLERYLQKIKTSTKKLPLPISAADGFNIEHIRKFIFKARKMYS